VAAVEAILAKCNTARSATADDAVSAAAGKGCRFSGNIYDMLQKDGGYASLVESIGANADFKTLLLGVNCAARKQEEKSQSASKEWNRAKENERVAKDTSEAFDAERGAYNAAF